MYSVLSLFSSAFRFTLLYILFHNTVIYASAAVSGLMQDTALYFVLLIPDRLFAGLIPAPNRYMKLFYHLIIYIIITLLVYAAALVLTYLGVMPF